MVNIVGFNPSLTATYRPTMQRRASSLTDNTPLYLPVFNKTVKGLMFAVVAGLMTLGCNKAYKNQINAEQAYLQKLADEEATAPNTWPAPKYEATAPRTQLSWQDEAAAPNTRPVPEGEGWICDTPPPPACYGSQCPAEDRRPTVYDGPTGCWRFLSPEVYDPPVDVRPSW